MSSSFLRRLIHNVNNAVLNTKYSMYIHLALLADETYKHHNVTLQL